jgi:hypothetical protein
MSGLALATWPDDRARHGLPFSARAADEHPVVPGGVRHGPGAGGKRGKLSRAGLAVSSSEKTTIRITAR